MIFLHRKVKKPGEKVYILLNFENSENRCKEVTSPISGHNVQSKGARFTMKIQY